MTSRTLTGRIPELDGLRGIAIGLVMIQHFVVGTGADAAPATLLHYALKVCTLAWSGVTSFSSCRVS